MNRDFDEDINWGKLFLKVILIFVAILLIIWLVSKFILKGSNSDPDTTFEDNLNEMYKVAEKYFEDESKLPKNGEHTTIKLQDMIDNKLIDPLKVGKTTCSTKSSYAKVSNKDEKYTLKVLLTCGSDSDYISKVIKDNSKEEQKEEQKEEEKDNTETREANTQSNQEQNNTESSQNNSSNNNSQPTEKQTVTDYTTKEYKFCKINDETYNTVIYIDNSNIYKGYQMTYSVKLDTINNATKIKVIDDNYFTSKTYYDKYKQDLDKNFTIVNASSASSSINSLSSFMISSLKSSNFDYQLSDVYSKDNNYYIDITITIKKVSKTSTTINNTKANYVPINFTVSYANLNDCVTDTYKNSSKYSKYYVIVK